MMRGSRAKGLWEKRSTLSAIWSGSRPRAQPAPATAPELLPTTARTRTPPLVQNLHHAHMGKASGSAASQGQGNTGALVPHFSPFTC